MIGHAEHLRSWWEWPIVVIDFETCGVDPAICEPVEIAAARLEKGEIVACHSALIRPSCPIPSEATAIHGITDEMVKDAECVEDAWCELVARDIVDGDTIPCAYNAPFDRTILHRVLWPKPEPRAYYLPLDTDLPWINPLVFIRDIDKYERGKKLTDACARRGIEVANAHRALGDAEACGRLLFALKDRIGNMTISELLRRQAIRAEIQEQEYAEYVARQRQHEAQP